MLHYWYMWSKVLDYNYEVVSDSCAASQLDEMVAVTGRYKDKLTRIRESMLRLAERSAALRARAERLQEAKQAQALQREVKRSAHQEREQQMIAKNDSDSN